MGTVYEFVTKMLVALQMTLPWVWQVLVGTDGYWWVPADLVNLAGTGGYWRVLVGTGGYWWVLVGTCGYWWVLVGTGGYW